MLSKKSEQQHVEKEIQLNFLVCLNFAASSCRLNWHEVTPITILMENSRRGMAECLIAERAFHSLVSDLFHFVPANERVLVIKSPIRTISFGDSKNILNLADKSAYMSRRELKFLNQS